MAEHIADLIAFRENPDGSLSVVPKEHKPSCHLCGAECSPRPFMWQGQLTFLCFDCWCAVLGD